LSKVAALNDGFCPVNKNQAVAARLLGGEGQHTNRNGNTYGEHD